MFLRMVVGIVVGVEMALTSIAWGQESTKTFHQGPVQGERFRFRDEANGVRILEICPHTMSKARKRLLVFATPNGNTAEQSLGCIAAEGIDWHFDIQHIGAQYRWLRDRSEDCDWILVIVQSSQLSWPAFRQSNPQADGQIRKIVESLQQEWQADETYLSCHSGGGSFLWGWMNAYETLPSTVQRLIFLDANYSYSDELHHGDKLLQWLKNDAKNRLFVLAYDDREITLDGKKVVGETGGTFRATERMVKRFGLEEKGKEGTWLDFRTRSFFEERIQCLVHRNPQNAILHTRLVGEMNGLIAACCWEEGMTIQSLLNGPRCYSEKVQTLPIRDPRKSNARQLASVPRMSLDLPTRPHDAFTGSEFAKRMESMEREESDQAIASEIRRGNVPDWARWLVPIEWDFETKDGESSTAQAWVMSDVFAIGSNDDALRIPMSPRLACELGDAMGCSLLTKRMSDHVFAAAQVKLAPRPMTERRDEVGTFLQHQGWIEQQLQGKSRDGIVVGTKKDLIVSNVLSKKAHRVALYGWHYPNGTPIQPVYAGHVDWYVDYSHGVRLLKNEVIVQHEKIDYREALKSELWHVAFSDEGPIDIQALRQVSQW
ncbi:MAG: hypothetical protein U0905_04365 [Pirellulales bacterium]